MSGSRDWAQLPELAVELARVSEAARGDYAVQRTRVEIVRAAPRVVPGATMAGLSSVRRDGAMETRACSDVMVMALDRLQSRLREGPCLAAGSTGGRSVITVPDTEAETRWPRFGAEAARLGVRSMLACGMVVPGGGTIALNLHAPGPEAFDPGAVRNATLFAAYCAAVLDQARLAEKLSSALANRQAIGEASGILMERHRIDSAQAFERLAGASQRLNVKLWLLAEYVVRTGADPDDIGADDIAHR